MKIRAKLVVAAALCLGLGSILVPPATGQELRGDIVGTAQDSSGGVLPGVLVTVAGPALIIPQTATTLAKGDYRFPSLPTGTYAVTFELSGFKTVRHEGIVLTLRKVMTVDAMMAPAAFAEEIQVVASAATIDVTTTSQGDELQQRSHEHDTGDPRHLVHHGARGGLPDGQPGRGRIEPRDPDRLLRLRQRPGGPNPG